MDLNKLVRDTKNWAARTVPENIEIETSLLARLWPVESDPSMSESALLNLILNARDSMPEGGKLTIETANIRIEAPYLDVQNEELPPGRYVMVAVSDTGHGIPENMLSKVFEPFFTTKAIGQGSGLGLSMVQGFMRQSGGAAQVYSEVGVGTTIKLYFPALAAPARNSTPKSKPDADVSSTGERILLVEDEPEVLKLLETLLGLAGYEVTSAKNGDEAKEIFEQNPKFDLLLTDIVMPGRLQGTTLSKELRAIDDTLPVVFMSGYAAEATVHGNGLRPEDIRLMKPVMRRDLLEAVARALRARNPMQGASEDLPL
jgi:CheY-like chemotaxis protein